MGPPPAVAEVRRRVRESTSDVGDGETVLVAVSGGADSIALLTAALHELPRRGVSVGMVTVDHGLQPGSARRGRALAGRATAAGAQLVEVAHVRVDGDRNTEAGARQARRRVLEAAATRWQARAILLAHTRDDQAETVLLGLSRGSGARSLAGMAPVAGWYRRPLLSVPRVTVRAAAAQSSLPVWHDPHNADLRFSRVRARHTVLPLLERELGPGVGAALARSAEQLRDDAAALDEWADRATAAVVGPGGVDTAAAAELPSAIRTRVLRRFLIDRGVSAGDLARQHVVDVGRLVVAWHGQEWVDLPGGFRASRRDGQVVLTAPRDTPA